MMIWQRFVSQSVQRLAGSLEAGHDFPCAGTDVAKTLGICARIVALFEPALPGADELGNRVDAIMEKLDSALSEAPPIVAGSEAGGMTSGSEADVPAALQAKTEALGVFGLSEAGHADEWPPTHLDEERMGAAEFSSAADVLASCARRDHAEFLVLLEVLAAMAAHGITEQKFKLSALFGCQFVAESPSPFFPLDENLAPSGESPRSSAQRDAREHLVVKLIGCNDLDTSLRVAGALGHNQQKVRLQFVLRAYEMGDESSLAAEATALIEDRYKLGVGLLTVARQRLARVLLAAQDRAETLQMERERAGRDGDGDRDERRAKLQLSEQEKKEQELLGLMQTKLALKQVRTMHSMILHCSTRGFCQWVLAAGPAYYSSGLSLQAIRNTLVLVIDALDMPQAKPKPAAPLFFGSL